MSTRSTCTVLMLAAGLLLAAPNARCQQALTPLTSSSRPHLDAQISPDGQTVGFRVGGQELGVVGVMSGIESTVYTSSTGTVDEFLWDPSSTSLYFVDGNNIGTVGRSGAGTRVLGTIAGSNVALWDIDSTGTSLFGTRYDSAMGLSHIFTLSTAGGAPPQDIFLLNAIVDEVRIDSSDSYLLFRSWSGSPFTAVTYVRLNVSTGGATTLWTSGASDNAQSACWLDAGQTIAFMMISPQPPNNWQIGSVGPAGTLEMLTDIYQFNRRTHVGRGGEWLICESFNPDLQGLTVGLMRATGGGMLMLGSGQRLFVNAGSLTGGLTIDDSESTVALCASTGPSDPNSQVYIGTIDDEIRIHPRIVTGQAFTIEMDAAAGELGAVAAAFNLQPSGPVAVPGIGGMFALQTGPGALSTVLAGVGNGATPLSASAQVPAVPSLVGFRLFFQGLRLSNLGGTFTRWGYMQVL